MNLEERLNKCKENFKHHEITIICDHEKVQRFQFRNPNDGNYGFSITCADNLIALTGDIYDLMITQGYNRSGLAFLLNHVTRDPWYYFLSKVSNKNKESLTEYSYDKAIENLELNFDEGCFDDNDDIKTKDDFKHILYLDEGEFWGLHAYYKFCSENNICEPYDSKVWTGTTILQIAGLQCFVEAYNKLKDKK